MQVSMVRIKSPVLLSAGVLQSSSFSAHSQLQGIMKKSEITLHTLFTLRQAGLKGGDAEDDDEEEEVVEDSDCKVFLCYLRSGAADSEGKSESEYYYEVNKDF